MIFDDGFWNRERFRYQMTLENWILWQWYLHYTR